MRWLRPILASWALLISCTLAELVSADYMPMNGAEVAGNIAEIRVEKDGIHVTLEIFVEDVEHYEDLIPDQWFKTPQPDRPSLVDRLLHFSQKGLSVRNASGNPLEPALVKLERRYRVDRSNALSGKINPLSGQPFPAPPEDPRVVYAELRYTFGTEKPEVIEFSPPAGPDGVPLVTIGMIVFDRGVPVTNFRFLSRPARLTLDWNDPWYSRFDNPNLRRHHTSGTTTYLYVEPREVRHEVLIRVRDLAPWLDMEIGPGTLLSQDDQDLIKERATGLLAERNTVNLDGKASAPTADRAHFLTLNASGLKLVDDAPALAADNAFLGVIFSFAVDEIPTEVSVDWQMFDDNITQVPAILTDPAGPFRSGATVEDPQIVWTNHLLGFERPEAKPVVAAIAIYPISGLSFFSAVLFGATAIFLAVSRPPRRHLTAAGGFALCCVALCWIATPSGSSKIQPLFVTMPEKANAAHVLEKLLNNVAVAHLAVHKDDRANALRGTVANQSFADVVAELDRALAVQIAEGGIGRISNIRNVGLETLKAHPTKTGFQTLANWSAEIRASHWGHDHLRNIEYRSLVEVIEQNGTWVLDAITVLEMKDPDV